MFNISFHFACTLCCGKDTIHLKCIKCYVLGFIEIKEEEFALKTIEVTFTGLYNFECKIIIITIVYFRTHKW